MTSTPSQQAPETVGRAAFFGGLLAGGAIALVGFNILPGGMASVPVEILTMALAMFVTTRIWRISARHSTQSSPSLDSPPGEKDRGA